MANYNKSGKDYQAETKKMKQALQNLAEEQMRECDHKPRGNFRVIPIAEYKGHISNRNQLPPSTAICTRCLATFDGETYKREETQSGIYMFNSMLHQIKSLAQLSDDDRENIERAFDALDTIANVTAYYNNMTEKLSNGGGKKQNGNRNSKGHIGVNTGMFGGRAY